MILTAVSTFVRDVILDKTGSVTAVRQGGPAHFFSQVFGVRSGVELITGPELEVEILVVPGEGEFGKVVSAVAPAPLPHIVSPNVLISTLHNEWEVSSLAKYSGRVFLDVQGFVRDPAAGFGKKKVWFEIEQVASKLFCVKATEVEMSYLPPRFIAEQRQSRCLIVTKGKEGSEIFYKSRRTTYAPQVVLNPRDTIGAGDTYFAAFVLEFLTSTDIQLSGEKATAAATRFLQSKEVM